MNCDKCKKIKAVVKYKNGKYCTWYCEKKKIKKDLTRIAFFRIFKC